MYSEAQIEVFLVCYYRVWVENQFMTVK